MIQQMRKFKKIIKDNQKKKLKRIHLKDEKVRKEQKQKEKNFKLQEIKNNLNQVRALQKYRPSNKRVFQNRKKNKN